jgi:hypothetical protein
MLWQLSQQGWVEAAGPVQICNISVTAHTPATGAETISPEVFQL